MISHFIIGLNLCASLFTQDPDLIRQVMRKHADGSPYVVLYFKTTTQELVKEEVFFPNGKIQWTGTYKDEVEDGIWKYYYENGRLKSEQHYTRGKEEGTFTDFDLSGKMVKQSVYKGGKLQREMSFN
jgi:antitoxin component YwqK of YwqJK toxin-antitoxin module